jgi:hypothetical protein
MFLITGKNYKKWKIDYGNNNVIYYSIDEVFLIMKNYLLNNNTKIANKNVCAFIICENIEIILKTESILEKNDLEVKYNPKVNPYWVFNDVNYDNKTISELYTVSNKIYIKN